MRRFRWPSKKPLICPWHHEKVLAIPIVYGFPVEQIEKAVRERKIVHQGCIMMPWRWWCPECEFPIPSEDGYWGDTTEAERNKRLQELKQRWEEEIRRRRLRYEA